MSLSDKIDRLEENVELVTKHLKDEEIRRVKKRVWKLPFGVRIKGRRAVKQKKFLAIILHRNKRLEFRLVKVVGGLLEVDGYNYKAYEDGAVYFYKKFPVVVILDWRVTLVGGKTDFDHANELGVGDFAQQTIIRIIEKVEVEKDLGKKKGRLSAGLIIIIFGVIVYLLSQGFFGG